MSKTVQGTHLTITVNSSDVDALRRLTACLETGGDPGDLSSLSARVERTSVEVCEACEGELTYEGEIECQACCTMICYSCVHYVDDLYVCEACAEKGKAAK